MARIDSLYPPSPDNVPADLTEPTGDYQNRMVLVLLSLIIFFGVYLFLLVTSGLMTLLCALLLFPVGLIPAFFFALFFLFLVKGFFKGSPPEKTFRLEITEEEHPTLFAFIERLCEETGAPLPHKVYISPEVNAAVFYNESLWSLFLPTPKNLLIGMGLVNVLTLSEFKAVLAHEFGHFSQKSMKLHQYVYSANHIIADMVLGRDWFDRFLLGMRDKAGWVGGAGWITWVVVWIFRKVLEGCYYGINFLSLSLSRQMEFNADLVAVSVSGSDAIVHALSRLDFASDALGQAFEDLRIASQHDLYTADLFFHHNHASAYLRRVRKKPHLGEPPALPDDPESSPEVFEADDDRTPEMWSTHPPCYDREQNAKEVYIRAPLDDRSPWLLFDDPGELRERLTRKFYRVVVGLPKDMDLDEPKQVQQFIDEEHAETNYDPRYHGAYDGRPINPGSIDDNEYAVRDQPWKAEVLARMAPRLWGDELKARMKEHWRLREEYQYLEAVKEGEVKLDGDEFRFRGRDYDRGDAKRLYKQVSRELDDDFDFLADLDKRVFRVHYQMARELGKDVAADLLHRYRFQMAVQNIDREIRSPRAAIESALAFLNNANGPLAYEQFQEIRAIFRDAYDSLEKSIALADKMKMPRLKNMKAGQSLGHFLLDRPLVKRLRPSAQTLTAKWINKLLGQIGEVQDRIRRIHYKNLGSLLACQETVRERWMAELSSIPSVELAEPEGRAPGKGKPAAQQPPEPKIKVVRTWSSNDKK